MRIRAHILGHCTAGIEFEKVVCSEEFPLLADVLAFIDSLVNPPFKSPLVQLPCPLLLLNYFVSTSSLSSLSSVLTLSLIDVLLNRPLTYQAVNIAICISYTIGQG